MSKFIIFIFLFVFFIYILQKKENFANYECPYSIVKLSDKILVYYNEKKLKKNKKDMVGINPIIFNSFNEYQKYMDYQGKKGIFCPTLNINNQNLIYPIEQVIKTGDVEKPSSIMKQILFSDFT